MALSRRQLQTARLHTVLTLQVRGHRYRYSDAALSLDNTDSAQGGSVLSVAAGLGEPDIVSEIAVSGAGLDPVPVSVTCGDEWAAVIANIKDASGELAQVAEGSDWKDRAILAFGRVSEPVYGASNETIDFGLGGDVWLDAGILPQPLWQACASSWPRSSAVNVLLPEDSDNAWYPIIFGHPGQGLTTGRPIPALLVEIDDTTEDNSANDAVVLLAYGHITADTVTLYNDSQDLSATLTPSYTLDNRGVPVTIVTVALADMAITSGDELWWRPDSGGGLRSLTGIGEMRSAGEVAQWILGYSTVPIDSTRMLSVIAQLQSYSLDFVVTEQISPLDLLEQILDILPIALSWGPNGAYLVSIPWKAVAADAIWQIDPDKYGGYRSSKVSTRPWSELLTVLKLEYNIDLQGNRYLSSLTNAYDAGGTDPLYQPHPMFAETVTRWPGVRSETLSTDIICDTATAAAILDYRSTVGSYLWEDVEVVLPQEYQAMNAGDVVVVTLEDIGWTAKVCYVVSVPRIGGEIVASFRTLPNWIHDGGGA